MACVSSAFIVGGGVAGLSAAIALRQAGVECDVAEVSDAPTGASIGISGRAAEALVELGVYAEVRAAGHVYEVGAAVPILSDAEGRLIRRGAERPVWAGAVDGVTIYRPTWLEIMAERARSLGARIRHGVTVSDIRLEDEGVSVTTTDGVERRYHLLLGADGIHSTTRTMLFPDAPKPEHAGQLSIRWMAPGPAVPDEGWFISPVGELGFYSLPPDGMMYVAAILTMREPRRLPDDEVHTLFSRLLDSISAPQVVELRKRYSRDSILIPTQFEWILMPRPWHNGPALLIGDAAHATTAHMGMGGGMALEDSVVLGQCVASATTLSDALETFMTRRYERVRTVVETSRQLSKLEQEGAPQSEYQKRAAAGFAALGEPY